MDSCFSFIVGIGEERLGACVEDSEHGTNWTEETTATNLLKMTFTNKLFGFFFLGRLSFWPYAMQPSTLKMRKCFRYKISHQFPLARSTCMHRERPEMHLGERWFRCFVVRKIIGVGNVVQLMNYVEDGLAYDLLAAEKPDRQRDASKPLSKFMFNDWLMRLMHLKTSTFLVGDSEIPTWIYRTMSWVHPFSRMICTFVSEIARQILKVKTINIRMPTVAVRWKFSLSIIYICRMCLIWSWVYESSSSVGTP